MDKRNFLTIIFLILPFVGFAQNEMLKSGPMVGYSTTDEVLLWAQTTEPAKVYFKYWKRDEPGEIYISEAVITSKSKGNTAKIIVNSVTPATQYGYSLFINDKPVELPYKTAFKTQRFWNRKKSADNFSVALGSCVYINDENGNNKESNLGGEYQIFNSILEKNPDLMLWLGDNVYLRDGEWNSISGIYSRYTQTRSLVEMQPLLGSVHHYAIWDDHDYGPNDSDRSFVHKDETLKAFEEFWGNPSFGLPGKKGTTTMFSWEDVDFFLTDNRYFRAPILRKSGDRTMFGREQLEWLIDALAFSEANFKMIVVGNLVLSTEKGRSQNYINGYEEERNYLLERIEEEGIKNVFFLTGDKHFSEVSKITNDNGIDIFDISTSPLTAKVNSRKVINYNQVPGSLIQQRNFGILEFTGQPSNRRMILTYYDSNGVPKWSKTFDHLDE